MQMKIVLLKLFVYKDITSIIRFFPSGMVDLSYFDLTTHWNMQL